MSYYQPRTPKTKVITEYVRETRTDYCGEKKVETTTTIITKKSENLGENLHNTNYAMLSPIHNSARAKPIQQNNFRSGAVTPVNMVRSPRTPQMQQQNYVKHGHTYYPDQTEYCNCGQCYATPK